MKKAVFIIDPTQMAKASGVVTGWNVYTTRGRRSQVRVCVRVRECVYLGGGADTVCVRVWGVSLWPELTQCVCVCVRESVCA